MEGLTFTEIIVAMWVISLLLCLSQVICRARIISGLLFCANNQRQLAIAYYFYHGDNNNMAPESDSADKPWPVLLAPYLDDGRFRADADCNPEFELTNMTKVLRCPVTAEPESQPYRGVPTGAEGGVGSALKRYRYNIINIPGSYAMNVWAGGDTGPFEEDDSLFSMSYRADVPGRSSVPLFADAIWIEAMPWDTDDVPVNWPGDYSLDTGCFEQGIGRLCTNRHKKFTNIAFGDCHTESITLGELWNQRWHKKFRTRTVPDSLIYPDPNNSY